MTFTLLLDLDDTLLDSNMDDFIPAYFQALSNSLKDVVSSETMIPALLGGTKRMMEKKDPRRFLFEVFDEYFFQKLGTDRNTLQPRINKFYDEIFPDLHFLTKQRPEAIDLVQWAFSEGMQVVIATNPLFPRKAIYHRLRWAGLPPEDYPFALVTTYENSHFTKENISYFPEILGKLGWQNRPVVMVGNDLKMDIEPAQAAGLPVYWVRAEGDESMDQENIPNGRIGDVRTWLEATPAGSLLHSTQNPSAMMAALRSTPSVLEDIFIGFDEDQLGIRPGPEEWSIKEVICHLRDVEIEVNLPRVEKVLSQENTFVTGMVTDPWVVERNYAGQNGKQALMDFIDARIRLIDQLDQLSVEWDKPVRHSIFGSSNLKELVSVMVGHDIAHVQQVHCAKDLPS